MKVGGKLTSNKGINLPETDIKSPALTEKDEKVLEFIINHPEVGILGVHKARDMPVVQNGQIVVRRIMNVSSSWDHRVVDGADGAALVQTLKRLLEHPALIFM